MKLENLEMGTWPDVATHLSFRVHRSSLLLLKRPGFYLLVLKVRSPSLSGLSFPI